MYKETCLRLPPINGTQETEQRIQGEGTRIMMMTRLLLPTSHAEIQSHFVYLEENRENISRTHEIPRLLTALSVVSRYKNYLTAIAVQYIRKISPSRVNEGSVYAIYKVVESFEGRKPFIIANFTRSDGKSTSLAVDYYDPFSKIALLISDETDDTESYESVCRDDAISDYEKHMHSIIVLPIVRKLQAGKERIIISDNVFFENLKTAVSLQLSFNIPEPRFGPETMDSDSGFTITKNKELIKNVNHYGRMIEASELGVIQNKQ